MQRSKRQRPSLRQVAEGALAIGNEMLRLLLRRPVLGVLAVALDGAGRIVLMRRRDTGTWCLPGGMLEWGETLETGLARELVEETGHRLVRVRRVVGIYGDPARDPRMHAVAVVFEVEVAPPAPGTPPPNLLETIEVAAFSVDALPSALAFDTRRHLDDWRGGGGTVWA